MDNHGRRLRYRNRVWRRGLLIVGRLAITLVVFFPLLSHAEKNGEITKTVNGATSDKAPVRTLSALAAGKPQEVIILFDAGEVEKEAFARRQRAGLMHDDASILDFRAERYRQLREKAKATLVTGEAETIRDYSHLPMSFMRFHSREALDKMLARPDVIAVYENKTVYPVLAQSLPLISQPAAASVGLSGSGSTVAVIDTGINYTLSAFGSCTAPGVPGGCKVCASVDVTGNSVTLNTDPNNHGTNVAGIVAGVAPDARIASVNAFSGGSSTFDLIISAINWAIANKSVYNIVAVNMSLGDGAKYTSSCGNIHTNPFVTPINNARAAGIIPVAASGNDAYTDGISCPACTPGVVSVGAVYDANVGGLNWGKCTDTTTTADKVTCFSNSAGFLTILAPGALITAAGITMGGTSQASPHVAGAAAVLRAAFPAETLDRTVDRMTSAGVSITDSRNGVSTPRLNLLAGVGAPTNDMFAARTVISGNSGGLTANNANATKEPGEPFHAGNAGGKSVWWSWTPAITGAATIDTHGSNFDTLLSVFTGSSVSTLTQVSASDNDGSTGNNSGLSFVAQAGTEYQIAVDGYSGDFGSITLNWNLSLQADLEVAMSQSPASPQTGSDLAYTVTVTNNGPSPATGIVLTDPLPAGTLFVSASNGCSRGSDVVSCDLGTLASGGTSTVQIVLDPLSAGELTNSVSVGSSTGDPVTSNNGASSTVTVVAAQAAAVPAISPWGICLVIACLMIYPLRRNGE